MLQVVSLFGDHVDLIEEFGHFLPGPSGQPSNISPYSRRNHISHHNYRSSSVSAVRTGHVGKVFLELVCLYANPLLRSC